MSPDGPSRSPWKYDVKPFSVVDNVYYVGNAYVSSHLFDTGEGLLLLDTGLMQTTYLLLESIRQLGFDPKDIRWILHSHCHIDHFGATRALQEKFGCMTYIPQADAPLLNTRPELNWSYDLELPYETPFDTYFAPDGYVNPGDVLTFGNTKVEVFDAAGHTPGTVAYRFTLPGGLKAAMHGGIGINTLSKQYAQKHNLGETWRDAFQRTIADLKDLEVDVVLGNHPYQANMFEKHNARTPEHNPFIDSKEWNRMISYAQRRFEENCL